MFLGTHELWPGRSIVLYSFSQKVSSNAESIVLFIFQFICIDTYHNATRTRQ